MWSCTPTISAPSAVSAVIVFLARFYRIAPFPKAQTGYKLPVGIENVVHVPGSGNLLDSGLTTAVQTALPSTSVDASVSCSVRSTQLCTAFVEVWKIS